MSGAPDARVVLFASAFRGEAALNITHIAQGDKTLCGRRGWVTEEGPPSILFDDTPDCLRCAASWRKRR